VSCYHGLALLVIIHHHAEVQLGLFQRVDYK
jgi:hypothetical protein